jgi:Zn-dependent protease
MLLLAFAIHESAHARMADHLGDPTARLQGRITLNPFVHLDPVGTLLILFFGFGWGKPVMFDPYNLRNPKRDSALIALAGPTSNFLMAIVTSIILHLVANSSSYFLSVSISQVLSIFLTLNVSLGVFNLIPIHPLDGFKVVAGFLPKKYYADWLSLERYGYIFLILLLLPFFGNAPVEMILGPVTNFITNLLLPGRGGVI